MKNKSRASFIFNVLVVLQAVFISAEATAQTETTKADVNAKPATIRVGLVTPKVQMPQAATDAADAVRSSLAADLTGSNIQLVPLDARLPEPIEAEAKEKDCGYVLYTSLTLKKGSSGGGGIFGRVIGAATSTATSGIPGGSVGASVIRTETADAITTAISRAVTGIKARDELSLEYKLYATGVATTPRLAQTVKAKAKQDGEDILSPLVEKAATALLKELTKK